MPHGGDGPCSSKPSTAAGDEAELTTCPGTQPSVQLQALKDGVYIRLLVNDASPSEGELGAAVESVFAELG
jgi:hypothetical protein